MHQLHKSERRVSCSQGPTSHPDPHTLAPSTGLPPCDPHRLLVSHHHQPSCEITPVGSGTPRTATSPHTPGASLSTAIASPAQPSTLNNTDRPLPPPNAPALISQTYRSVDQFFQFEGCGPRCQRYSCYKPKISSCLSPSCSVLLFLCRKECQVKL